MVVGARLWCRMPCWCQRRMGRLVRDDRKATLTQITTRYNQSIQNNISERTTRRTLKQMVYSSRRPHQVPLLSAKNRKWRLQFETGSPKLDNRRLEKCCLVWWISISAATFQMVGVRIWRKEHESMDPSCLVSMVQAGVGGVMVWEIFSWHTLGPLVAIEHRLNTTTYLSIVADHVHPFMTTVGTHLLIATSSRITHHVTKLKSSQTGFLNMAMSSLYSNGLHSHQISIQSSTFGMWWNGRFTSWICNWQICSVMLSCQYGPKSLRNVSKTLLNLSHKEFRQFWRQRGVQPGTSKVCLLKWPVSL